MGCGPSSSAAAVSGGAAPAAGDLRVARLAGGDPHSRRVKPPAPWAAPEPVSLSALASKRETFWASALAAGGQQAVWENLKLIAETMINRDFELANSLVGACDLRTPHADLSVVFDRAGRLYELPLFAYADPTNLVSDEEAAARAASARAAGASASPAAHRGPPQPVDAVLRVSAAAETLEQDVRLGGVKTDTRVRELKERLHAALVSGALDAGGAAAGAPSVAATASASPNKWAGRGLPPPRQRLMYRGRELKDDVCLQAAGVEPGADAVILQVFVRPS